ncbi:protein TIC110, chloroplastic-like [Trifolium pratense]|uniref:protein TIC110, chloroplastic-like n=1 Tax=Trifolium pratense TaxID=57577 RepID=UPI001E692D71|nr:protein TIC110, chloroplastic-like [Trifolium pratense]
MNPSSTLTPYSSFIPLPFSLSSSSKRHRFRVSFPCSSSSSSSCSVSSSVSPQKDLAGIEHVVDKLSPPIRLATSAVVIAGAVAAGFSLGSKFGGSRNAAVGGAVALGVAGGAAAFALNAAAPRVASVDLHKFVAGLDDPSMLKNEDIDEIVNRYGVKKQDEVFKAELCEIYREFVSSVLPPGGEELKGDEADRIISFKNSLGIDDPDAANMHIEVGRKYFRLRLEVGDREADIEQRKAFQKLIFVSYLVFGEQSSFLLPWKRIFKFTDSQVEVAIRDNAQRLYASKLKSISRDIDTEQLVTLREAQRLYRLSDQVAENLFKEHTRKMIAEIISVALNILKSRTRTVPGVIEAVEELDKILAFNDLLISLKNHADVDRFARGVGPVSLLGGKYDGDRKIIEDLKLLYRAYVTNALTGGHMEDNKLAALTQLRNIFGLGIREAEEITIDVTSKVYRKHLAKAFSGGELEMADSKAAFLQSLCDELHFDPQKACKIHEEIYRQKLQHLVTDGELSEEGAAALLRLRVMLCIPQNTVEAAHLDICGSLFGKVVMEAIASGVDGFDAEVRKSVRKSAHGLQLTREIAMSIASKAVRKMFITYIKRARGAEDSNESAKELKKMIAFNRLVVTELVKDIKGESDDVSAEELVEGVSKIEDEEWDALPTLRKTNPDKELIEKMGKPGQTEINLKDDLPGRDRTDLYKTYLLYCLTGDVTKIPFGAQIATKKNDSEFIFLNQLGGILGMSVKEIVDVHRSLAEQAFRQQAEVILADGQLTKAKVEQLINLQKEVGLPEEYAQKVIKSITTTKMAAAIETAVTQGQLNIKQIRELKESGVDLDNMVSNNMRELLFKKTVGDIFSSGSGEFDEEEVYENIPSDLNISKEKSRDVVRQLAQSRLSNSLIQAVALLRQRNHRGVVSSLNDILACDKAMPSHPLSWELSEELADLYTIFIKSNPTPEKLTRLQHLLGIRDSTAAALREMRGRLINTAVEEEEFVF